jgi:hypothetical protein
MKEFLWGTGPIEQLFFCLKSSLKKAWQSHSSLVFC